MKRLLLGIILVTACNALAQDSLNVRCLSQQRMWEMFWGVVVRGNYAYLAAYGDGLWVMDVSDPANSIEVGYCDTPGFAWNLVVEGNYAYIADRISGLRIIDISDPTSPFEVGFYDTPGEATDVKVRNGLAYVADDGRGLRIIDVSNPHAPAEIGFCETNWGSAGNVTIMDSIAFVTSDWTTFSIVDIHDPTSPIEVGYWSTPTSLERVSDVAIYGNYVYVSSWGEDFFGIRILDISNPVSPTEVASRWGGMGRLIIRGHYLFTSGGGYIFDIANPVVPIVVGEFHTFCWIHRGIDVNNDYLYIAVNRDGLYIFDISILSSPVAVSNYIPPHSAIDVCIRDTLAYVANDFSVMWIMDISNPSTPQYVGKCPVPELFEGIRGARLTVDENYAYVTARGRGLFIVDVSDPSVPTQIIQYSATGSDTYWDVAVRNGYAYLAVDGGILRIVNVSDPAAPQPVGLCNIAGQVSTVALAGDYAYVASSWGLTIADISDPELPTVIGAVQTNRGVGIAVNEPYAYMTDGDSGLVIIDISDPTAPEVVGSYPTPGFCSDVAVHGSFAYLTDYVGGLHVLNIEDPAHPGEVGFYNTPGQSRGLAVSDSLVFVADYSYFGIYDCSIDLSVTQKPQVSPLEWSLHPAYPNPFNPITQLSFNVPQSERVTVNVYNIAGQLVTTLLDDRLSPGLHAISFDGSSLSSGVYLCRLNAPGFTATQKMVLVK
ncbi:MAG: T9SS type A sorting domain-containing protein [Calditrichota bacterium]